MNLRLHQFYDEVTSSFWFIPTLMALLAAGAAFGSVALDERLKDDWVNNAGWIWSGSASGARSVLSTVAGSVMTVVSIVFSITITALAQMSSQYGPRILRNFTSDRGNQVTLGTFIATFIYCLLVLRTVRSVEESPFVPDLSVTIGIGMAIASLAVLIYFIHHVSQNIQAEHFIAGVGHEFETILPHLFPERIGHSRDDQNQSPGELLSNINWQEADVIVARHQGYMQRIDEDEIMQTACKHDLIVKLQKRPGDFVGKGTVLLQVWPPTRSETETKQRLRDCFSFGPNRIQNQDASYPLQQLVEIAARALSPGINEPFTAMTCIDWLGASLRGVAMRTIPSPLRYDDRSKLRLIAQPFQFEDLAATAFNQIRLYGSSNPDVAIHLLNAIAELAPHLHRESDRQTLIHHTQLISTDASQTSNEVDRWRIEQKRRQTLNALSALPSA